jgi:MFS family permease
VVDQITWLSTSLLLMACAAPPSPTQSSWSCFSDRQVSVLCLHCAANLCCCPQYDDQILQLFTSSLFLAGAFAALVAMVTSKKLGRRFTMICGGLAFIIGKPHSMRLALPLACKA